MLKIDEIGSQSQVNCNFSLKVATIGLIDSNGKYGKFKENVS